MCIRDRPRGDHLSVNSMSPNWSFLPCPADIHFWVSGRWRGGFGEASARVYSKKHCVFCAFIRLFPFCIPGHRFVFDLKKIMNAFSQLEGSEHGMWDGVEGDFMSCKLSGLVSWWMRHITFMLSVNFGCSYPSMLFNFFIIFFYVCCSGKMCLRRSLKVWEKWSAIFKALEVCQKWIIQFRSLKIYDFWLLLSNWHASDFLPDFENNQLW